LLPTYTDATFNGDLLYFRAAQGDHVADAGAWPSRITGEIITHDIACTHHTMTQAEPIALIGRLITEYLGRD
jgi:thioesterase domain-containing protein